MEGLLYLLAFIIPLIAQIYVSATYKKNSKKDNAFGLTGYDVARKILDKNELNDLYVVETKGTMTDHYDPTRKTVKLSTDVYHGKSVASLAIAAHECGHAIQDKEGYLFLRIRSFIYPIVNLGTRLAYIILLLGLILEYMDLIGNDDKLIGIIAYRGKDSNTIISNEFPIQDDTTLFNLYDKGFHGDTTLVFKTKFLKKYHFPIIPNEKFITENVLYYEIDKKYKYRLVPTILTIGYYQNDGYTSNSNRIIKDNPLGWSLYYIKKAYLQKKYLNKLKFIFQSLSLYFYANDRKRLDLYSYLNKFDYIYLPIGYILGIARKIKYSFSR